MQHILRRLLKNQKGQVFIVVLILMLLSALIITPLLSYQYSGRAATNLNEVRMMEQYAADAGVEDAFNRIRAKHIFTPDDLPKSTGDTVLYDPGIFLNGMTVTPVAITYWDENTFKVVAAASEGKRSGTVITSYLTIANFFEYLLKNAITSPSHVNVENNGTVDGIIQTPDLELGNGVTFDPENHDTSPVTWPPFIGLSDYYKGQIPLANYVSGPYTITLSSNTAVGPLYVDGDLTIDASAGGFGYLDGIVYVTGRVEFLNKAMTLKLGDNNAAVSYAIYAEGQGCPDYTPTGSPPGNYSIYIPPKVNLYGPGSIISEKSILFKPNVASEDFLFVLSTHGNVEMQPSNNTSFTGSIAGDVNVLIEQNNTIKWAEPPPFLNVPGSEYYDYNIIQQVLTWDISFFDPDNITIMNLELSDGYVNVPYSQKLFAIGGTGAYTWDIITLPQFTPPGLGIPEGSDTISGVPTTPGDYTFTIRVRDSKNHQAAQSLTINISELVITTDSPLDSGWENTQYEVIRVLTAKNGAPPYTWSWSGDTPTGLGIYSDSGIIWGTPTVAKDFSFTVKVTDAYSNNATQDFIMSIYEKPAVTTVTAENIIISGSNKCATLKGTLDVLGTAPGIYITAFFVISSDGGTTYAYDSPIYVTNPPQPMSGSSITTPLGLSVTTGYDYAKNTTYYYIFGIKAVAADGAVVYVYDYLNPKTF
jgi:hypothetical protein